MTDLLIFDGRHLLFRAADVHKHLHVEIDGKYVSTGAIYGFLMVLMTVHRRWGGLVAVAWEGDHNFRFQLYPEYKRKQPLSDGDKLFRDDMNKQEVRLKEVLSSLGIPQWSGRNCEADDVLGTISTKMASKGYKVIVYTGDSDLRQLVNAQISVVAPGFKGKDKLYTHAEVVEKHGVEPNLLADYKALAGDGSDNIPGIRGIGPKKAAALVSMYGDVESVIRGAQGNGDWPIPERFKSEIIDKACDIRLYKQLTTIKRDVELVKIGPSKNNKEFIQRLKDYKFASLITFSKLQALRRMVG